MATRKNDITIHMPEQKHEINVEAPSFTLNPQELNLEMPVHVNVPETKVEVNVPKTEMQKPNVTVNLPAPKVTVNNQIDIPEVTESFVVERDEEGRAQKIEKTVKQKKKK
jgi:hypothetical protein